MAAIPALRVPSSWPIDRARVIVLLALAVQGFIFATNGVAAPWIMRSFALDQAGLARAFAWVSVSAIGAFALSRAADRIGRVRVLVWASAIEAFAGVAAALAPSIVVFTFADVALLSSAGGAMTCGIVWMAEATSRAHRARGQSLAGFAVVAGSGPAIVLMPWLASTPISWRALPAMAAAAIALVPSLRRDVRDAAHGQPSTPRATADGPATPFDRRYRALTAVFIVTTVLGTIATATVASWRYVHLVDDVGLPAAAASATIVFAGIAALAGFPIGAAASDRIGRVPSVAAFQSLMAIALMWAFWGPPPTIHRPILWVAGGLAVASLSANAITVAANTTLAECYPASLRATIFGWLYLSGSLAQIAAQALIAAMTPLVGRASIAVGAMAALGLPSAVLYLRFVRFDESSAPSPRPARLRIGPALASILLTALGMEAAVRVAAPRAVMVPWQDDIRGVTAPRMSVRGRFAIPGEFDTTVTIHDRFRGRDAVTFEPAPGTTRIAVLGDSVTFGWGAEDDETYPAVLQRALRARAGASRPVEVLNAGVIGTGTGEQALWYDLWVRRFHPSIVVLSVFWNDIDDDLRGSFFESTDGVVRPRPFDRLERGLRPVRLARAAAGMAPGFEWLSQHSQLLTWVRQAPTELFTALHAQMLGDDHALDPRTAFSGAELALWRGELQWLRSRLPPGTRLAVVVLPSAESFDASRPGAREVAAKSAQLVAALDEFGRESGTPLFDVGAALRDAAHASALFLARDPHPNPAGYQAIGEAVASFLTRAHVVE